MKLSHFLAMSMIPGFQRGNFCKERGMVKSQVAVKERVSSGCVRITLASKIGRQFCDKNALLHALERGAPMFTSGVV